MFSRLLRPGKRLMRNVRMPEKFSIIVVTLLIPMLLLLFLFVGKANEDIAFTKREISGVDLHKKIAPSMPATLESRDQAILQLLALNDIKRRRQYQA